MTLEPALAREGHDYLSTACYHEVHDRCRQVCKFCPKPCRCQCHATEASPPARPAVEP